MKAYDDDDFFINDRDEDDDTLDSLIDEEYNTFTLSIHPSSMPRMTMPSGMTTKMKMRTLSLRVTPLKMMMISMMRMKKISIRTNLTRFST